MNKFTTLLACSILSVASAAEQQTIGASSSNMYKVKASTDVLGRHNSKVAKTPTVFLATPKTDAALFKEAASITPATGRHENYIYNGSYMDNYWFNDSFMSEYNYLKKAENYDKYFANAVETIGRSYTNYNYLNTGYTVSREAFDPDSQTYTAGDYVDGEWVDETYFNIDKILKNIGASQKEGNNIGIYVAETLAPNKTEADYDPLYTCASPSIELRKVDHASKIVKTIKKAAPKSTVYTIPMNCLSDKKLNSPERPDLKSPAIYIGNHSYGDGERATDNSDYDNAETRYIDSYVYNTRVIEFASAGNAAKRGTINRISQKGRGLNVITVGAISTVPNASGKIVARYKDFSSRRNPVIYSTPSTKNSYDKPEIYTPSNLLFRNDYIYHYTNNNTNGKYNAKPVFNATSAASPFTAGLTAKLLHQKPFYKWHPEVVKALLLTASTLPINSTAEQTDDIKNNTNKLIGKGYPSYEAMIMGNRSRYWVGNNTDFFKSAQLIYRNRMSTKSFITFKETNITAGKKYRVAISWLSDPNLIDNASTDTKKHLVPQDLNLMVAQGNDKYYSDSENNPFEFLEFTARSNSDLTIRIIRERNNGGRVMLGYNLYEVP